MSNKDLDARAMLQKAIREQGEVLDRGILKVDAFLNHQVDTLLMVEIGRCLADTFRQESPTKVLTAETSGIAPALTTAIALGVPLVFAKRELPVTMAGMLVYTEATIPPNKGGWVNLFVSSEVLLPPDRVLIVDDFLASGQTILALARICQKAGCHVVSVGAVIEKRFQRGQETIRRVFPNLRIVSMAIITSISRSGTITFAAEE